MGNTRDFEEEIRRIDELIVASQVGQARSLLDGLEIRLIPRQLRVEFADLARRTLMNDLALRILRPIVRAETIFPQPTPREKIIYGSTLIKIGATKEATDLFRTINWKKNPEVLLFESFGLFSRWEYSRALTLLKRYVRSPLLDEYQRLIGQLNLAAAMVSEGLVEGANAQLEVVEQLARAQNRRLVVGYSLEPRAQLAMQEGDYDLALELLEKAYPYLKDASKLYSFFVRKWQAICKAMATRDGKGDQVTKIRREAIRLKHYETIRECDFYLSLIREDKDLFRQVYIKTPYRSYRKKMLKLSPWPETQFSGGIYAVQLNVSKQEGSVEVDVALGVCKEACFELKPGQQLHRLLQLVSNDLYRPVSMGALFSELFAGEFFDPTTSVDRLIKAVGRLNRSFIKHKVPLMIQRRKGAFQLQASAPVKLLLSVERNYAPGEELLLTKLKQKWPYQAFSTADAGKVLGMSTRSANKILKQAKSQGRVYVSGTTRDRRYRFAA